MAVVSFHDTLGLSPRQLLAANRAAKGQEAAVLDVFHAAGRPLTPSEVWAKCSDAGKRWPLTSIRRAITNLTGDGLLVKLEDQRDGLYGQPEHCWALPGGQLELFQRRRA